MVLVAWCGGKGGDVGPGRVDEKDAQVDARLAGVTHRTWVIDVDKADGLASGDGVDVKESTGVSGVSVAAVAEGLASGLAKGLSKGLAQELAQGLMAVECHGGAEVCPNLGPALDSLSRPK